MQDTTGDINGCASEVHEHGAAPWLPTATTGRVSRENQNAALKGWNRCMQTRGCSKHYHCRNTELPQHESYAQAQLCSALHVTESLH